MLTFHNMNLKISYVSFELSPVIIFTIAIKPCITSEIFTVMASPAIACVRPVLNSKYSVERDTVHFPMNQWLFAQL